MKNAIIPIEKIDQAIIMIRGQKVMIDSDLAEIYGVKTKALNQQVKRNIERFPSDFMFQLTTKEKVEVVANCDHLNNLKFSTTNPYAFTEHGAIMLASVLNTRKAVQTSVFIVRAFVKLREILATHKELARKLLAIENKYDKQFKVVFQVIRELMKPDKTKKELPRIGYKVGKSKNK